MIGFAWLNHLNPPVLLHDDSIRNQLLARDCTDLGRCHLVVAAFAVATAINVHVAAFSLVVPLVMMAALAGRRPWYEITVAVAVFVATYLVSSSAALRANVMALAERGRITSALMGGTIVTFV